MAEAFDPWESLFTEGMKQYLGGANPFRKLAESTDYSEIPGKTPFTAARGLLASPLEDWYRQSTPHRRAYHGYLAGHSGTYDEFRMPERMEEKGVFFSPDPSTAGRYAGAGRYPNEKGIYGDKAGSWTAARSGGAVFPVDIDLTNAKTVDAKGKMYDSDWVDAQMRNARNRGHDFLIIKNMQDVGGDHDQIVSLKPAGKVKSATTGATMLSWLLGALMGAKKDDNQ